MKKMKTRISNAMGALAVFCTSPAVLMAAEEEETRSRGEVIQTALLNTVMSIAIVFLALLLISRIIALFVYINKFEAKMKAKNAPQAAAPSPEPEPELEPEEEELSDDLELVAVITAAIAAYEEENGVVVPADELVVRSIKKVNKARWQNA